ncbi:MAG TPA: hypothetical protein VE866_00505, partial [Candidatus Binatia bacterium]|nr:hypothetical protein [Candidatus Binatia bacterium]
WRDAYRGYIAMFTPRAEAPSSRNTDKEENEHRRIMTEFAAKVAEYERIEPRPGFRNRSPAISMWPEDDPMKPLALAAIEALRDLQTGVRVRDSAVNAYGVIDDYDGVLAEPDSAGSGVGEMINLAPKESVELYRLVSRLGERDVKKGISRLLKTEDAEVAPQQSKRVSQ